MDFDKEIYDSLIQRYNEIIRSQTDPKEDPIPYKIDTTIIEIDTGKINAEYMDMRFNKYIKALTQEKINEAELKHLLDYLHKSFSLLSQEYQKYANLFIHDIESGDIILEPNKTFNDYLNMYAQKAKNDEISIFSQTFGYSENDLRNIMNKIVNENNINDFGRIENLAKTVNMQKAKTYFEKAEGKALEPYEVFIKSERLLREFVLSGGFNINRKEID